MLSKESNYKKFMWLAGSLILLASVMACVKTLFVSIDIDESYAVAVSYRIARGERLFRDLWEAHQLGSVFLAPFFRLYLALFGTTDYIVLFARALGMLIHGLFGMYLYRSFRKEIGTWHAFLLFVLHFTFLPKWVQLPEFELQQYWFFLWQFLLLYRFWLSEEKEKQLWRVFAAGVLLVCQMYSYPTLMLLYPYFAVVLWCICRKQKPLRCVLVFTAGALAAGGIFLGYLFSYMSPNELMTFIGLAFTDESHTLVSVSDKWLIFGAEFWVICGASLLCMVGAFVLGMTTIALRRRGWKKSVADGEVLSGEMFRADVLFFSCSWLLAIVGIVQAVGCLFFDENQFFWLWRYFTIWAAAVLWFAFGLRRHHKSGQIQSGLQACFSLAVLPCILVLLSVLVMTNMDMNTSMGKMYPAVIGTVCMLFLYHSKRGELSRWILQLCVLCFIGGLFVCKLIQIRVTGCLETTVLAPLAKVEEGPAAGIYVLQDLHTVWEDDYRELTRILTPEDRLLYMGAENLVYLWTEAAPATPSTQGTNAYNEMFVRYFEMFPEKMPTVVVVDKELFVNPVYYNSPQNEILLNWIAGNYGEPAENTAFMSIYFAHSRGKASD